MKYTIEELLNNAKKQQRPSTVHLSKRNNNNELIQFEHY